MKHCFLALSHGSRSSARTSRRQLPRGRRTSGRTTVVSWYSLCSKEGQRLLRLCWRDLAGSVRNSGTRMLSWVRAVMDPECLVLGSRFNRGTASINLYLGPAGP